MINKKNFLIRKYKWHRIFKREIAFILAIKDKFLMFQFIEYKL